MQTFLPYPNFTETAKCLNRLHLGKQRSETKRLLEINLMIKDGQTFQCNYCGKYHYFNEFPNNGCDRCYSVTYTRKNPMEENIPYKNHPATLMWRGFETALCFYGFVMCQEWKVRKYNDNLTDFFLKILNELHPDLKMGAYFHDGYLPSQFLPKWLGNDELHISHRSNLLRKFPEHYSKFFPDINPYLPYFWPILKKENLK